MLASCGTKTTPRRLMSRGARPAMLCPASATVPDRGATSPAIAFRKSRFAGPVRAENGDDLAGRDFEVDALHNFVVAAVAGDDLVVAREL